jgi:diamine N-acetyltransferase
LENFYIVSDQIVIRQAVLEDYEMLTDLAYSTFWDAFHDHPKNAPHDLADYMQKAFGLEQVRSELSDPASIFLIAEIESETAGYAKLIIDSTEHGITAENPVELNRLYSHQKFLGKGVGQKLMDACFKKGLELGHDVMWLGVWEYNPRAQRFYEKNGFYQVGKHTFQLGSDPQIDLLMQKEL